MDKLYAVLVRVSRITSQYEPNSKWKFQQILNNFLVNKQAISSPNWWFAGLVLVIAFLYSSVGFGGASGYLAVMGWFEIPTNVAVSTALTLNLIVAGIAFINYYRSGHFIPKLLFPFVITSIPAAFLGGLISLSQDTYLVILHAILFIISLRLLLNRDDNSGQKEPQPPSIWVTLLVGAGLGLLAGMIGIGGGVFLSPIIILMQWGNPKHASATSAGFILLNSLSGLTGRALAGNFTFGIFGLILIPIGIVGSLMGSTLGANYFSGTTIKRLLGIVLMLAVIRFVYGLIFLNKGSFVDLSILFF